MTLLNGTLSKYYEIKGKYIHYVESYLPQITVLLLPLTQEKYMDSKLSKKIEKMGEEIPEIEEHTLEEVMSDDMLGTFKEEYTE